MKKFFFILVAAMMAVCLKAEQSLPRTYCGCTLGQTVYKDVFSTDSKIPDSAVLPWNLAISAGTCVYVGDFIVEDHHFSILTMSFYKDTLYKMEFRDEEINNDIMELNRAFMRNYQRKYASFEKWLSKDDQEEEKFISCTKTDGILGVTIIGSKTSLQLSISYLRLADESWQAAIGGLFASKQGPNYDEKNKVTSIAGVRFGETRANTINAFKQRGTFMKNEGQLSYFSDMSFGGGSYNIAMLYFQYDSRRYESVLAAARFEKNFYEWRKEEAVMMYEAVVSKFQGKYSNCLVLKDEEDSKAMVCGMLEDDYEGGNLPPIIVSFELGVSRGGDKFYYVTVSYFGKRMNSVAADDI